MFVFIFLGWIEGVWSKWMVVLVGVGIVSREMEDRFGMNVFSFFIGGDVVLCCC